MIKHVEFKRVFFQAFFLYFYDWSITTTTTILRKWNLNAKLAEEEKVTLSIIFI